MSEKYFVVINGIEQEVELRILNKYQPCWVKRVKYDGKIQYFKIDKNTDMAIVQEISEEYTTSLNATKNEAYLRGLLNE